MNKTRGKGILPGVNAGVDFGSGEDRTAYGSPAGSVGKGGVNAAPHAGNATVRVAAEQLVMLPTKELKPYGNNARTHGKEQLRQLRASLREFGFITPILVDFENNVIAGHGRLEAAKAEGMEEVPCVLVSSLTEAQRRAYILADNRLAEQADWNMALVELELGALAELQFDTALTGFLQMAEQAESEPLELAPELEKPRGKMRAPKTCICPECGCEFSPGGKA